jgi:hypothetical protein
MAGTPQDRPVGSGQDSGGKQGRRSAIKSTIAASGDLVEGAQGKAAARQPAVNLGVPERQKPARNPVSSLDPADLFPKGVHLGWGSSHGWIQLTG